LHAAGRLEASRGHRLVRQSVTDIHAGYVVAWLRERRHEAAISTITIGELLTRLALSPDGRRMDFLTIHVEGLITRARERSCSHDEQAARALPTIVAARKRIGREASKPVDAMIAAVAASRDMAVATRNTSDFAGHGHRTDRRIRGRPG
jgi:toxin FitB